MKRFFILLFSLVSLVSGVNAQTNAELTVINLANEEKDVFVWGMSSDGNYLTGYINGRLNSFIWTKAGGIDEFDQGIGFSESYDVSNNGVVVGKFPDPTYQFEGENIISAGYYSGNAWHSLGIKPGTILNSEVGSMTEAISANGSIAAGGWFSSPENEFRRAPVVWTIAGETVTPEELPYRKEYNGALIVAMSDDGSTLGGWADYMNMRVPLLWNEGDTVYITHNGLRLSGEVMDISPNGRYAALFINQDAALYDIQTGRLTIIPKGENAFETRANCVSDNGMVLGFHQTGVFLRDRVAFIYSEQLGIIILSDYIEELGIEIPETMTFATPSGISADGSILAGFGEIIAGPNDYIYTVGWYVEISEHLAGLNPAKNLTATENGYGNIDLIWDSADPDENHQLNGYNIYRNGEIINGTQPVTQTNYSDNSLQNGSYVYQVTAVWDNQESIPTYEAKANTGKFNLPFYDDFSTNGIDGKYWNTSSNLGVWAIGQNGINPPGISFTNPKGNIYDESIMSAHITTEGADDLFLSYNIAIAIGPYNWGTGTPYPYDDILNIEIFDGDEWNLIETYEPYENNDGTREAVWEYKTNDISSYAGTEIILRLRAVGDNPGSDIVWNIDNINIYSSDNAFIIEKPLKFSNYKDENGFVHLNWVDPNDVVNLSYNEDNESVVAIGNEGVPFIAAIMFDPRDMDEINGYKLTTITAYMNRLNGITEAAQYKLAVFKGTERVISQNIDNYTANAWNTFTLENPVIIDASQPLYFGLEVISHNVSDWPVGLSSSRLAELDGELINVNDGRSNLISEDNGQTWKKLSEFGSEEGSFLESLAINGFVENVENSLPKDRMLGYRIYRNGEEVLENIYGPGALTILNNFTDIDSPTTIETCYEISAYYNIQQESEKTDPLCMENPLNIVEYVPAQDATGVALNSEVTIRFNLNITILDESKIFISPDPGNVQIINNGRALLISHNNFVNNSTYTVNILDGAIEGYSGDISWSFITTENTNVEENSVSKVSIYPNPSSGLVNIEVAEKSIIKILDISGRIIETWNVNTNSIINFTQSSGIYFVQVENNGNISTYKIVIK